MIVVEFAADDLVRGLADGIGDLGVQPEVLVDGGGRLLQHPEGLDHGERHTLGRAVADREVLDGAESLRPIVLLVGDLELTLERKRKDLVNKPSFRLARSGGIALFNGLSFQ